MAEAFRRTCLGCGASRPKQELIRIAGTAAGEVFPDKAGTAGGRGAYFCPKSECFEKGRKKLKRALRCEVSAGKLEELMARVGELIVNC